MAHDIASMDAAAMLEAARADVSPAAEVVRLRRGLPPKPPNRLTLLFFMLLIFGLAALVLMPPRSPLFADVPYVEAGVLIVLGLLVLGLAVALVAKIGPPDERLLLAVWYLRCMFATADDQQMPPIQQSVGDALSEAKAQQHPQVLWLDDLSRVRGVKRFMWWLDTPQFILLLIAFVWYIRPCFALPLSPVCQPIGAMTLAPYLFWIGSIGLRYLIRGLRTHSSAVVADVAGIRLEFGRRRERHIGWSEVRSLTRLTFRNNATYTSHYLYVLDTGDMALAWGYNIIATGGLWSLLPRNRPEDEQLAQTIAAHSETPMRDGSALLLAVASAAKAAFYPDWPKLLAPKRSAPPVQLPPQMLAAMDAVSPHPRLEKRDILALIAPLIYAAFCVVGWTLWN